MAAVHPITCDAFRRLRAFHSVTRAAINKPTIAINEAPKPNVYSNGIASCGTSI